MDTRSYGKTVFEEHIKEILKPVAAKRRARAPLLCNHGISGSGKTVQQSLNMHWFTEHFENGVAIEVTFNDDAEVLKMKASSITDEYQFEESLGRAIILRLIEFCHGTNYSSNEVPAINFLTLDFLPILKKMYPLGRKLAKPLMFVRDVLGLCADTPILLAVDELVKLHKPKKDKNGEEDYSDVISYLGIICCEMDCNFGNDIDKKYQARTIWLSVSTYGCFPLVQFARFM